MTGVWVVYLWDSHPVVMAIYDDELEARRQARDGNAAAFVPFGQDFREAIERG